MYAKMSAFSTQNWSCPPLNPKKWNPAYAHGTNTSKTKVVIVCSLDLNCQDIAHLFQQSSYETKCLKMRKENWKTDNFWDNFWLTISFHREETHFRIFREKYATFIDRTIRGQNCHFTTVVIISNTNGVWNKNFGNLHKNNEHWSASIYFFYLHALLHF